MFLLAGSRERLLDRHVELSTSGSEIHAEMNPQGAPIAVGVDLEVATGLGSLDDAEGVLLAGHGDIRRHHRR